jgi:MFS superfamily sulfate permease-like transporter
MKNIIIRRNQGEFPFRTRCILSSTPLCLGIALASGAPPLSGIIAGIVGGLVVGFLSNSNISVSGPAAGLTAIVLTAITDLGAFELFFVPGLLQDYSIGFRLCKSRKYFQLFSQ